METFVREALARAVYEREEAEAEIGKGTGDGFLQVCIHAVIFKTTKRLMVISRWKIWRSLRRSYCWTSNKQKTHK
jgi:hypothetical protein